MPPGSYRTIAFSAPWGSVLTGNFTVCTLRCGRQTVTTRQVIPVKQIAPFRIQDPNWLVVQSLPPLGRHPVISLLPRTAVPSEFDQISAHLTRLCQHAILHSGLNDLVYYPSREPPDCLAKRSPFSPQVDLSAILISPCREILGVADVLYDRDHSDTLPVVVKRETITANDQIEFYAWSEDRWLNPALWNAPVPPGDVLTHPVNPRAKFMLPYPANCMKTLVAFSMMRLVDSDIVSLESIITYDTTECPVKNNIPISLPLGYLLTQMISIDSNFAAEVLLQWLFKNDQLDGANAFFQQLGLQTLTLQPLHKSCGRGWYEGKITVGSLDLAKLLMIIFGVRGNLWWINAETPVVADAVLSPSSQEYLQQLMGQQAYAQALNPLAVCGAPFQEQGFRTTVLPRYINRFGYLAVYSPLDDDSANFGYDMRPCLEHATSAFAHKTGLGGFSGADHGWLERLDGSGNRLIVSLHTSAGTLFQSPELADQRPDACYTLRICYANAFAKIAQVLEPLTCADPRDLA